MSEANCTKESCAWCKCRDAEIAKLRAEVERVKEEKNRFDDESRAYIKLRDVALDERDRLRAELEPLRWMRDEINKRVMPGESDSQDATFELIRGLRAERDQLRAEVERLRADAKAELKKDGWLCSPESQRYFAEECAKDVKESTIECDQLRKRIEALERVVEEAPRYSGVGIQFGFCWISLESILKTSGPIVNHRFHEWLTRHRAALDALEQGGGL